MAGLQMNRGGAPFFATLAFASTFITMARGHDHHGNSKIAEGETVSVDPIVGDDYQKLARA